MGRAWHPSEPYNPPSDELRERHLASCVAAAEAVLASNAITPQLRKKLLNQIVWEATEWNHKLRLRYRSEGVMDLPEKGYRSQLRHEHVVTRKWISANLLAHPDRVADVLGATTACLVTKDEAVQLNRVPADLEGWERYEHAGIKVHDMADDGRVVPWDELANENPIPDL